MRAKVIACQTVGEELIHLLPEDMPYTFLEFGLHQTPEKLQAALQDEIDRTTDEFDTLLFGYGMCCKGTVGLHARRFRLVIPRVDDCIALFLGSKEEYRRQCRLVPGTFFLTKGWIECGDDPYTEYKKLCERYGEEKAMRIEKMFLANYTRLALIDTGNHNLAASRQYAAMQAEFFGLTLEEIPGSNRMLEKLLHGPWDDDFIVAEPGQTVGFGQFLPGWPD